MSSCLEAQLPSFFRLVGVVFVLLGALFFSMCPVLALDASFPAAPSSGKQQYLTYFEEVYKMMQDHYYFEVRRQDFDRFLEVFDKKIYPSILLEGKSNDYVRWRSAAYLVDALKQPDDQFSRYLPPKPAAEFAKEVYGKKIDLGIEGHLIEQGYLVDFIEPRSDAFAKGLRINDLIVQIDGEPVIKLDEKALKDKFNPLEGAKVLINYFSGETRSPRTLEAVSREYFKQGVFEKPTGVPGIFCLDLQKFNEGTPDDFSRLMGEIAIKDPKGLIIDLRGNPGGPPLAARAISSFFLPNGETLVYFEGRNRPRAELDIPVIPPQFHVNWPMAVLVNKGTGSASELFSGVLQDRKRAVIIGEDTAGQVLLKSMFDLSDGSTLALVQARGHFPDGRPFPFDGVHPDEKFPADQSEEMVPMAAKYLYFKSQGKI
jgi:carboxyl-terminal processing protease